MKRRILAFAVFGIMFYLGLGAFLSNAQEAHVEVLDFGAGQVFSTFFQAQRIDDLVLFRNGSVASASLLNNEFAFTNEAGEQVSVAREDLLALSFREIDGEPGAQVYTRNAHPFGGKLRTDLQINYALPTESQVPLSELHAIIFKLEPIRMEQTEADGDGNEQSTVTEIVHVDFSQIFPIMTRMFASMSVFDTAILPDNRLASIALDNREDLSVTINSDSFGQFTFPADEIAYVQFAQEEDERDVLVLQNGDRASGEIILDQELSGSLGMGEGEFTFNEAALRSNFKQIVFQLPIDFFGGGTGGRGQFITPEDDEG
jgi:hypothetical protein